MITGDVHTLVGDRLKADLEEIENDLGADAVTFFGPVVFGVDDLIREAVESITARRNKLAIILETPGGVVEVVERMVDTVRHFYSEVVFVVPDRAMSAGTVFVLSGDAIFMDYYSLLGPIDPQLQKDGKLVPALAYLIQYERMKEKSANHQLTTAELALLQKLDLGELQAFEEAKELSISLLKKWLVAYKFKDWTVTTSGKTVTDEMKTERAQMIAERLSDPQHWHSHGRGIPMKELQDEDIRLKIDNFGELSSASTIKRYSRVASDYMKKQGINIFVHSRFFCEPTFVNGG